MRKVSHRQARSGLRVAGVALVMLALALAVGVWVRFPAANALAAPLPNLTPAATTGARNGTAIPCLIVATSGCPQVSGAAPISVQAPGGVVVAGANWAPDADVTVLLVPATQSCTAPPAASTQARASTAGVFSVALRLPPAAPNGALYGLCASTTAASTKQTFPAAGLAAPSPLRLRIVRAQQAAARAPSPAPPIDGFSLAALALAALSAGAFALSWLRRQRAKASAGR